MTYRYGDCHQQMMFPPIIEELVPEDAPVRAYDAIVQAMDLATSRVVSLWLRPTEGCRRLGTVDTESINGLCQL